MSREQLVDQWFKLTRKTMPGLAKERDWPVHLDHCFQRILLDNAVGGLWRAAIEPPAYRNARTETLAKAIELGERVVAGETDLASLNRKSLEWRGKL